MCSGRSKVNAARSAEWTQEEWNLRTCQWGVFCDLGKKFQFPEGPRSGFPLRIVKNVPMSRSVANPVGGQKHPLRIARLGSTVEFSLERSERRRKRRASNDLE